MKKIIFILVTLFSFVFTSCDTIKDTGIGIFNSIFNNQNTLTIKDGKDKNHKIVVHDFFKNRKELGFTDKSTTTQFVQNIFDKAKYKSENPYTFIPKEIFGFQIKDTINITFNINNTTYTLYAFTCFVNGVAKNKYNVDQEVRYTIGNPYDISLYDDYDDGIQFFMKNNIPSESFIPTNPLYFILSKYIFSDTNEEELINSETITKSKETGARWVERYFKYKKNMYCIHICLD